MSSILLSDQIIEYFNISSYTIAAPGGQKTVFIVTIDNQKYAFKIIKIADERFEREVSICYQFIENVGIPSILKIEKYGNDTIILEQYIEGHDLTEKIEEFKFNEQKIFKFLLDISNILQPVWEANFVHRDLKPANIRITENGMPVILDFGIARALNENSLTATGGQPHSWPFASPEQLDGKKELISYRTDFFSLGIIAFYLYTNKLPFGESKTAIYEAFEKGKLSVNTSSDRINKFCSSVLKKNPSERPRKIENFKKLLM